MVQIGAESEVSEENYVPVDESKLKEDQQKEYLEAVERCKRECLKSYNTTRSGDVIKKFDFPSFQPLTETQRCWRLPTSPVMTPADANLGWQYFMNHE